MNKGEDYKILNVSKKAFEDYRKIEKVPGFKNMSGLLNKHLFILAVVLGFKHNKYLELSGPEKHSGGYCRVETLSNEDKSIIKAIAINKSNDINILIDQKRQYQIAEAYANGGISILKELVNKPGDLFINLQSELQEAK